MDGAMSGGTSHSPCRDATTYNFTHSLTPSPTHSMQGKPVLSITCARVCAHAPVASAPRISARPCTVHKHGWRHLLTRTLARLV